MKIKKIAFLLALITFCFQATILAQNETRLLRFPTIHNNQIVFTYAGDLYTVGSAGGTARKLTNDIGYEMFARFSHDGKTIAFTAQYDGNTEVYTINSQGGIPKRITYTATLNRDDVADRMGPNNLVMGWMNDNKNIVFRTRKKSFNSFNGSLYTVNIDGGLAKELPFPRGGFCSFSPDDQKLAFNRIFREFRTWKRYRGGMADDVWIFDFKTKKTINITNNPAQDIIPMWHGNKIYYLSDKGDYKRMNLYVYDLQSKQTKKVTDFKDFDIKFPSLGNKAIVYENGGYIYKMDLGTEASQKVIITIMEDFVSGRSEYKDVSKNVSNFEIAPDGNRALFGAHGDVFTVPKKYGETRNLTQTSGIHERNSKWSPDGKWISFISDRTGEDEIYKQAQDGSKAAVQLTSKGKAYKYHPFWSPNSEKLLWSDSEHKLKYIDVNTKKVVDVDHDPNRAIRSFAWSPDSKWITYTKSGDNRFTKIYIYSVGQKKSYPVTSDWYNSGQSVFSNDGKYLFFISNREYNTGFSQVEFDISYNDMGNIYFVTLAKETKSLFDPKSDEVTFVKKEDKPKDSKEKKKDKKSAKNSTVTKIDIDGIQDRIGRLPLPASRYFNLASVENKLYFNRSGNKDKKPIFYIYDFDKRKETKLGFVGGYEISADNKKMMVSQNGSYGIIDLPSSEIKIKDKLDLSDMQIYMNKQEGWQQIYNESWRQLREFFFDPNMHGVDWEAMKKNYAPLVKHVNHRNDLTYVIGELVSELNVGHAYVSGGDRPMPERIKMGLLGAEVEKDKSGYFRITKILKGQNWDKSLKSPLSDIGVNANEGDYILAINGQSTKEMNNMYKALVNTAGKQVKLELNSKPTEQGKKEVTVVPISDESQLYYLKWVSDNIEKVNKATNDKVGYIHIPDMGIGGMNEFVKYYYPQLSKKALVIDVRGNGGGFVSPLIIERLRRVAVQINISRNGTPVFNRDGSMNGPLVMLSDEFSASDGDIVTYRFQKQKLGKVVGKRTWGGVVGYGGFLPLVDGGVLIKPEHSRYDLEGKEWIMEGKGVEPDIFVDNDPYLEYTGTDQQLNKAIEVILEELKTKERSIPDPPPYPDKR